MCVCVCVWSSAVSAHCHRMLKLDADRLKQGSRREDWEDEEEEWEEDWVSDEEPEEDSKLPAAEPDGRVVCFEGVSLNRQVMRSNLSKVAAVAAGVHPGILKAPSYRDTPTTRRAQIYGDKKKASKQGKRTVNSVTS